MHVWLILFCLATFCGTGCSLLPAGGLYVRDVWTDTWGAGCTLCLPACHAVQLTAVGSWQLARISFLSDATYAWRTSLHWY